MRIIVVINLFLCVLFVLPAHAEVFTGGTGTTNWLDNANWQDGSSSGNNATFAPLYVKAESDRHAVISPSAITVVEGDSDSYSISLAWETGMVPTADVQVTATPTINGSDVSLSAGYATP